MLPHRYWEALVVNVLNSTAYWCDFDISEQVPAGWIENLHELSEVIEARNTPAKNRNRALFNTFCALDRSDSTTEAYSVLYPCYVSTSS